MTRTSLSIATVVIAFGVSVTGQGQAQKKFTGGPVTLADQGSFFIGGTTKVTDFNLPPGPPGGAPGTPTPTPAPPPAPQHITIGQMYVQFQIPAKQSSPGWPVIMVHGSTHTGAALESTPDGREGWYPYFVRKGVATYVVDQSGRGRSGFDQTVLHEAKAKALAGDARAAADLIPTFGRITDNGAWTAWFGHLVPAGSNVTNGTLIVHGDARDEGKNPEGTPHAATLFPTDYAAEYYKQLVPNAEVTLPGSTCATCTPQTLAAAHTWTPQNLALLVERLGGAIVATHSQSGIMGHHMIRILKERNHLDLVKGLITIEGGCSLPNSGLTAADFDQIPYLVLKGDYAGTSAQCQETVDAIKQRRTQKMGAATAEYMKLDEMGMPGVTHMMMLDRRNLEIADIMLKWVGKNVPKRRR
jgi:hypothetical protein